MFPVPLLANFNLPLNPTSPLAMAERPRRAIAGANMAKLMLEEDDADDFYKTAYGGFEEDESDREYTTEQEQSDVFDRYAVIFMCCTFTKLLANVLTCA